MRFKLRGNGNALFNRLLRSNSRLINSVAHAVLAIGLKGQRFDASAYSAWQGGLIEIGVNPVVHAAAFGVRDRILGLRESFESVIKEPNNPSLDWLLVVTHDQTRTGAPILALNLVTELSKRYNVATLSLGPGELRRNFLEESGAFYQNHGRTSSPHRFAKRVQAVVGQHGFASAVVNSIESAWVIEALANQGVRSIALIHEFPDYSVIRDSTLRGLARASKVVFSSNSARDSFRESGVVLEKTKTVVLHQGACQIPAPMDSASGIDRSFRSRAEKALNLASSDIPLRLVGAGFVQYRKGVDLFITLASRIITIPGFETSRFLWIGDGYDPKDITYGAYIQDQIRRLDLSDHISILPSSHDYSFALSISDCLALTSRLDPFPNVSIDALRVGVPVACFEGASGFSEFALANDVLRPFVAPYLDVERMALGITSFFANRSSTERSDNKAAVQAEFETHFSFEKYANALEELAKDES